MANENWLRTYTMKCGKMGKKGFEIGNLNDATETVLHVSFSIEKSEVESPNTAKVQIWNLSDSNLKIIESKDCVVELKAGYNCNDALILVGNVTSAVTTPDNADRMTELDIMDGRVELRDTTIKVSLNGSVNCKDIYKKIAGKMGLPIVFAGDLSFKKMPHGFSYTGKAKNALQKVAKYCGHKWTIQNQIIQITLPGRAVNSRAYLLDSDSGLISIPKRIKIDSGSEKQGERTGWEIVYLLNGAIGVNDVVQIKSPTVSGYFRICKVTIDGDNMEGDWVCTAQVVKIPAQSKLDKKADKNKKGK